MSSASTRRGREGTQRKGHKKMAGFGEFFEEIAGVSPHAWQTELAEDVTCRDRTIRIPTGFGKTAGVVLAWLYHRVRRGDASWPHRLVFCLPMRVLVEQTERTVKEWLDKAGHRNVRVFVLLGGREEARWVDHIDSPAILIGTQDMLLSRALNRGYGSARGLWPMEMGLLHCDTLWVTDEVQLMDVGLATSAQLRAFRIDDERRESVLAPARTWWMSATLQPDWLNTVDHVRVLKDHVLGATAIAPGSRSGGLWEVKKRLERDESATAPQELAALVRKHHRAGTVSLLIVNTVDRAVKAFAELEKLAKKDKAAQAITDLRLVHSRFRGAEREGWTFLRREACGQGVDRIIVATQVVEAGVDLSARLLVTDLAPWSSLVQRFGRCARYAGEEGHAIVAGAVPADERKAAPYDPPSLAAAHEALVRLVEEGADAGPRSLEEAEERWLAQDPAFVARLFPYEPLHVLRRRDFDDLFDTTPDLSGADLDVSRFIRTGDERDVRVFWRHVEGESRVLANEAREIEPPSRAELCPVPVGSLDEWLKKAKTTAYALDYLDGKWKRAERIVPGKNILLACSAGGYDTRCGWDPSSTNPVAPVRPEDMSKEPAFVLETTSASCEDDGLSVADAWKTIATHGHEEAGEVSKIAEALALPTAIARVLVLAARWHDIGKVHPQFQHAIIETARTKTERPIALRHDLAKAPDGAWRRPHPYPERPGFRHELASTLALFELLRRRAPDHPALLGTHAELFTAMGEDPMPLSDEDRVASHPLVDEIAELSAEDFDLLAWLVCTHHGKVRCTWTSTPRDQEKEHGGIHGVVEGDVLPSLALCAASGERIELPSLTLSLAPAELGVGTRYGSSWSERTASLLRRFGPMQLAALEAVLRVADFRASALTTEDDA